MVRTWKMPQMWEETHPTPSTSPWPHQRHRCRGAWGSRQHQEDHEGPSDGAGHLGQGPWGLAWAQDGGLLPFLIKQLPLCPPTPGSQEMVGEGSGALL